MRQQETERAKLSELYKLCSWEDNGYHDSDWYLVAWNPTTGKPERREVGTTRCSAGCNVQGRGYLEPTPEVVRAAVAWLADYIYEKIHAAEYSDVMEPESAKHGDELVLLRNCRHKGQIIPKGSWGDVFWSGAFGQFYRNGYNRPGRGNTRVGLRLPDGHKVFVALSACRLRREPMSDVELRERAECLAWDCKFSAAFGCKSWESYNWAAPVAKTLREAEREAVAA